MCPAELLGTADIGEMMNRRSFGAMAVAGAITMLTDVGRGHAAMLRDPSAPTPTAEIHMWSTRLADSHSMDFM